MKRKEKKEKKSILGDKGPEAEVCLCPLISSGSKYCPIVKHVQFWNVHMLTYFWVSKQAKMQERMKEQKKSSRETNVSSQEEGELMVCSTLFQLWCEMCVYECKYI